MKIDEYLLTVVSEECSEIIKNVSKQLRFGGRDHGPENSTENREKVMEEFYDLVSTVEKCQRMNILPEWGNTRIKLHKEAKNIKIEKYIEVSKNLNRIDK